MFGFKSYLNRKKFIELVDSKRIWNKSLSIAEIKDLLKLLKEEIEKHKYKEDKNFIMDERRKGLKRYIEEKLLNTYFDPNTIIAECLFNFWEFVNNEYHSITPLLLQELNLTIQDVDKMCKAYNNTGIICLQEKDAILEMINKMETFLLDNKI